MVAIAVGVAYCLGTSPFWDVGDFVVVFTLADAGVWRRNTRGPFDPIVMAVTGVVVLDWLDWLPVDSAVIRIRCSMVTFVDGQHSGHG